MTASGFPTVDAPSPKQAVAYTRARRDTAWHPTTEPWFYRAMPAGGAAITARDLMRFGDALLNHVLLDAAHTDLLTTGKVEIDRGGRYAYGVLDRRADGDAWFGHGGGAAGISTDLRTYPWSGHVVVALATVDPPVADEVVNEFADWLLR